MVDASGTTDYTYDAIGRRTEETRTQNGHAFSVQYGYDTLGRLSSVTYPGGRVISYTFDTTDPSRIATIVSTIGPSEDTLVSSISYDPGNIPVKRGR